MPFSEECACDHKGIDKECRQNLLRRNSSARWQESFRNAVWCRKPWPSICFWPFFLCCFLGWGCSVDLCEAKTVRNLLRGFRRSSRQAAGSSYPISCCGGKSTLYTGHCLARSGAAGRLAGSKTYHGRYFPDLPGSQKTLLPWSPASRPSFVFRDDCGLGRSSCAKCF